MTLVWRGMGIMVPITFIISHLLTGWITGDTDYTLGNTHILSWASLWTAIVCLLLGVVTLGGTEETDEQGNKFKRKHDFFWLPVLVWGIVFGGLSIYLLFFTGKTEPTPAPSDLTTDADSVTVPEEAPQNRVVNFYNPTSDSMTYIVVDETADGLIDRRKVGPKSYLSTELPEGTYLFSAFDAHKVETVTLPAKEDASDEKRYKLFKDDKGSFYQRILGAPTPETDDYDEAWLIMDGKTDFLVVNVTEACAADYTPAKLKIASWADLIQEELDSRDLVEPLYRSFIKDKQIKVVEPGATIPTTIQPDWTVFLLVPYRGEKDKNAVITKAVQAARF